MNACIKSCISDSSQHPSNLELQQDTKSISPRRDEKNVTIHVVTTPTAKPLNTSQELSAVLS